MKKLKKYFSEMLLLYGRMLDLDGTVVSAR